MAAYDLFLKNEHSSWAQELMVRNNERLINWVLNKYFKSSGKISLLEIGPGKGYLHDAICKQGSKTVEYYAFDRNEAILKNLNISSDHLILGSLPDINIDRKFDIIFAGYVIEHLKNGLELFETISKLKSCLSDNGILILEFPDCMKMGMEFYNIDYTHAFPTTKRNVNQAIIDNDMYVDADVDINGLLFTRKVDSRVAYMMRRALLCLYNYNFMNGIFKPFYRIPKWDLKNIFWRFYALVKEPNVLYVVKRLNQL